MQQNLRKETTSKLVTKAKKAKNVESLIVVPEKATMSEMYRKGFVEHILKTRQWWKNDDVMLMKCYIVGGMNEFNVE